MIENKEKTKVFDSNQVKGILDGNITGFREPCSEELQHALSGPFTARQVSAKRPPYDEFIAKAPFQLGDLVHVLEEWIPPHPKINPGHMDGQCYKATNCMPDKMDWQPANTLPVELSRIKLKIMGVKVQKLGKLSREEMRVEGARISFQVDSEMQGGWDSELQFEYSKLWNKLHPDHPYDKDRWTFAYEFKLLKKEDK